MMGDRKYIVATCGDDFSHVTVFSWTLTHSDVAKGIRRSMRSSHLTGPFTIRSAGFIDNRGRPYGRSESLNLDGHEDDEEVLRDFLGAGYVLDEGAVKEVPFGDLLREMVRLGDSQMLSHKDEQRMVSAWLQGEVTPELREEVVESLAELREKIKCVLEDSK